MAARRAARAAARACARSGCVADRLGLERRARASPADEDVTESDSIPAERINQSAPGVITDFRAEAFLRALIQAVEAGGGAAKDGFAFGRGELAEELGQFGPHLDVAAA